MADSDNEWFSDDQFWLSYAPLMFDAARWAEVPTIVDGIISMTSLPAGSAVLDSCCGPGRHGLEFARRGYKVCGVDITASYIEAFGESATAEGLDVELVHADVRSFRRPASFDLALNLFTSFGYFATIEEDRSYAASLYESLKPGGQLVMDMVGKETAARDFTEGEWFERDGKLILTEFSVVGTWEGLRNRWLIIDGERRIDRSWVQRLYSAVEMQTMLRAVGFSQLAIYGSCRQTPYDNTAASLVVLATK